MAPKAGRPKSENPRTERVAVYLTKEELEEAEEIRSKDKEPQRTLAAWFARKFFEMLRKKKK